MQDNLSDVGMLVIAWAALLAFLGYGQIGVSRRSRLAGAVLGVALLIVGELIETSRRILRRT